MTPLAQIRSEFERESLDSERPGRRVARVIAPQVSSHDVFARSQATQSPFVEHLIRTTRRVVSDLQTVGQAAARASRNLVEANLVRLLLDDLEHTFAHHSALRQVLTHPSFLLLSEVDDAAIAGVLDRLAAREGPSALWLILLQRLTGHDAAAGTDSIAEASTRWVAWAAEQGIDSRTS